MTKTKKVLTVILTMFVCCLAVLTMSACDPTTEKGELEVTSNTISATAFTGDKFEFGDWRMKLLRDNISKVEYTGEDGTTKTTFEDDTTDGGTDAYDKACAAGVVFSGLNRAEASAGGTYTIKVAYKRAETTITVTITAAA